MQLLKPTMPSAARTLARSAASAAQSKQYGRALAVSEISTQIAAERGERSAGRRRRHGPGQARRGSLRDRTGMDGLQAAHVGTSLLGPTGHSAVDDAHAETMNQDLTVRTAHESVKDSAHELAEDAAYARTGAGARVSWRWAARPSHAQTSARTTQRHRRGCRARVVRKRAIRQAQVRAGTNAVLQAKARSA